MTKIRSILGVCLTAVLIAPVCLAHEGSTGHADITTSAPDTSPRMGQRYSYSAILQPNGGIAGQFEAVFDFGATSVRVHGSVDCVAVTLNKAKIGGTIRHSSNEDVFPVGQQFIWNVTDNGEGANDASDSASPMLALPAGFSDLAFCAAGGPIFELPVNRGNIQVRP